MSTKNLILSGAVVVLIAVLGLFVLQQQHSKHETINISQLISAINNGQVTQIEKHDNELIITYVDDETRTMSIRGNEESIPQLLASHGAETNRLDTIAFSYSSSDNMSLFPLIWFGLAFGYYAVVLYVIYQLRNRVQDDTARAIWAGVILTVPLFGLIAFVFATRPTNTQLA